MRCKQSLLRQSVLQDRWRGCKNWHNLRWQMDPKQEIDNSLLLIASWIQTTSGRLPLAWGFPLDARVWGGGIEMMKHGILHRNVFIFYVGHSYIHLAFDVGAAINKGFSYVFRISLPNLSLNSLFCTLGCGMPIIPCKFNWQSIVNAVSFLEEFLLLVSDFSLWHCGSFWLFSVVLRVSEVNSLLSTHSWNMFRIGQLLSLKFMVVEAESDWMWFVHSHIIFGLLEIQQFCWRVNWVSLFWGHFVRCCSGWADRNPRILYN